MGRHNSDNFDNCVKNKTRKTMGQYYSTKAVETIQNLVETSGGVRYEILLANPDVLRPLKYSAVPERTTRFLWHFQATERRRQEFLAARVARAHFHNQDHLGAVQTQKQFLEFGQIDLSCFKERKVRKVRSRVSQPRFDSQNRTRNSNKDFKRNRNHHRRQQRQFTNFDYNYCH